MRIGVVARCLNTSHVRGMGRYVHEILRLGAAAGRDEWVPFGNDPLKPMHLPAALDGAADIFEFRGDRLHLWEQVGLPRRAVYRQVDVLHCTEGAACLWQPVPTVVTVHDTLAWTEREPGAGPRLYWESVQTRALARSAAVVTISESSRRDILARWPALEPKLHVVPHGIDPVYLDPSAESQPSPLQAGLGSAPYLVYLGGPMARKRFDWAAQVLMQPQVQQALPGLKLVACGFGAAAAEAARRALPAGVSERVHFAPYLSDPELRALYRASVAVLYPTLYEGFGFPIIEAQACGVPVLFSPVSSMAELVGPLSLTAPPRDMPAWCDRLLQAAGLGAARSAAADAARAWAMRFSWERSFAAHAQVYEAAARQARTTERRP
jgi:alpha-1,3-rhamnosyl/mannosyltransferase